MSEPRDEGKVVLVTGAAQGIGRCCALYLLDHGWRVAGLDTAGEAGVELAVGAGVDERFVFIHADVRDEATVAAAIAEVVDRFGGIDAVVNNAAIASPGGTPLEELDLEAWREVIDTNLTGVFLVSKHAAAALRRSGGAIVNIASTRALQSEPDTEAYSASKGGVLALTHAMAMSLGPEIRVNSISPGWIDVSAWRGRGAAGGHADRDRSGGVRRAGDDRSGEADRAAGGHADRTGGGARDEEADRTGEADHLREIDHRQHPAGRVGRPEDIASMAAWLLSDEAGFVTGANFVVDGGMTRKMIYEE